MSELNAMSCRVGYEVVGEISIHLMKGTSVTRYVVVRRCMKSEGRVWGLGSEGKKKKKEDKVGIRRAVSAVR